MFILIRTEPVKVYLATGMRAYQIRTCNPDIQIVDLDDGQVTAVEEGEGHGADCFVTESEGYDGFIWDTAGEVDAALKVFDPAKHERARRLGQLRELEGEIRNVAVCLWAQTVDDPETATTASEAAETDPERLRIRVVMKIVDIAAELMEAIAQNTLTVEFLTNEVSSRVSILVAQIAAIGAKEPEREVDLDVYETHGEPLDSDEVAERSGVA